MNMLDVFDNQTLDYICSFEQTEENILNFVADLAPFEYIRLVDCSSDELILTTAGNFLDTVPNQCWLKKIAPRLVEKQMGNDEILPVKTFNRFEMNEKI